jgi:hypothetical protein
MVHTQEPPAAARRRPPRRRAFLATERGRGRGRNTIDRRRAAIRSLHRTQRNPVQSPELAELLDVYRVGSFSG